MRFPFSVGFIGFLVIGLCCCLLLSSCIDPINLTLEDEDEFLVIDGSFTSEYGAHPLKLYYSTGQRTKARREVTDAQITLFENGGEKSVYLETKPGNYQLVNNSLAATPNNSYHIEIVLPSGQIYRSEPEKSPIKIKGERVFFDFVIKQEQTVVGSIGRPYIDVFVATPLPTNQDFWIRWEVINMYDFMEVLCSPVQSVTPTCYVIGEQNVQEITLLDGTNVAADYLPKFKVSEKFIPGEDAEFRGLHYFLVHQKSITKRAHIYWQNINSLANQTGSIFDAPPAPIKGNIVNVNNPEEVVLGYFEVANEDVIRGYVTQADFINFYRFTENVCPTNNNPFARRDFACCQCEQLPNSTMIKPSWWK